MGTIVVPELSESVVEATVSEWVVNVGDNVEVGDVLVVLETDKVSLEVAAEEAGTITSIVAAEDEDVTAGQVLGAIAAGAAQPVAQAAAPAAASAPAPTPAPVPASTSNHNDGVRATPVARNMAQELGIDLAQIPANGNKIDKADVQAFVSSRVSAPAPAQQPRPAAQPEETLRPLRQDERREKMSRRRRTIARNLIQAQQTAAMLTTFNEVDMSAVMEFRSRKKEAFKEKYGVSLGINSFFVKAAVGALKAYPRLNAEIEGDYVIDKDYFDVGIAVGSEDGLVVPVLRNVGNMTMAQIEQAIKGYAKQVQEGTLPIEAIRGGSFTITNGGVFGSLLSTPILNAPQVGILGLHGIKERPVVVDGEIVVRPMMYTALTYDHRIVDGRTAVQFLVRLKELIEDVETLLIEG